MASGISGWFAELEFVSVIPFQRIVSFQERVALPGIFLRFAAAVDFKRVNDPDDPFALANGQFLLFSRDAYFRIGGHRAIRLEVSDDLAFARAAKQQRVASCTVFGEQHIETRMYRSLREIWTGFSKNAVEIMHASSVTAIVIDTLVSFGLAFGALLPIVVLCSAKPHGSLLWNVSLALCVATLGALTVFFTPALRALRAPVVYLVACPFGLAVHGAITLNAYFRKRSESREWKGRRY
jgi:hypothetical protein